MDKRLLDIFAPRFWWELCGRYTTHFIKKFGFFSHCVGCTFISILFAFRLQNYYKVILSLAERESHDGKSKVNQISISLNAYQYFLKKFDIELFLPLRHIKSGEEIEAI